MGDGFEGTGADDTEEEGGLKKVPPKVPTLPRADRTKKSSHR